LQSGRARVLVWPVNRRTALLAFLVGVLAVLAYAPALGAGWIWDDDSYVTENPLVQSPDGLSGIWSLTRDPQTGEIVSHTPQYYPFVFTSFWIEHALWGLRPFGYHATNLVLHLLVAWLAWRVLVRLGLPGAGIAAAIFALHPMHVESVAWVTERKNLLSGAFYLLAFLAYLRFDAERRARWWLLAFLAFAAALLSKSVTATLPIVLGAAVFWRRKRLGWGDLLPLLPFVAIGALSGWFTAHLEQVKVGAVGADSWRMTAYRLALVPPRAWWHYVQTTWFPHPIQFVYPRWELDVRDVVGWIAAAGIAVLVLVLWFTRKRLGWAPMLLVFASAVTLAPALGFVPVYPHRFSWVADHFAYLGSLPLIALAVLVADAAGRRWIPETSRARTALAAAAAVLAVLAARTHVAARNYHDARTLWEHTLSVNPQAWIAETNLGIELMKDPARTPQDVARARRLFESATQSVRGREQAWSNLAQWHLVHGDYVRAAECFRASLAADPTHRRAHGGLEQALLAQVQSLGSTRAALDAIGAARSEIGQDPRFAQLEAWVLATRPDPRPGDAQRARTIAEKLVAQRPDEPGLLDTLAAACAAGGDFASAVRHAENASRRAAPAAQAQIRARLDLYRSGKRFVAEAR
jgi:Flp pilus assembly protein TadD